MAAQLLLGRYTGYRLSELFRFRDFLGQKPELRIVGTKIDRPLAASHACEPQAARGASMLWLFRAAKHLKELGILGMNRRNAACILDHNPRALFPLVDDKLRMHHLCRRIGVPTPDIYAVIGSHSELRRLTADRWRARRFCRQAEPRLGRPRRPGPHWPRRQCLRAPQRRTAALRADAAAHLRHSLRHVFVGRPAGPGIVAAACPAASDLRGHLLQGHPGYPRYPLSQRAGDGDAAPADEGIQRPSQSASGRHRHRRRS